MFSVRLSIVAETMKDSVSSSVSRLTRYDTNCLALPILLSSAHLTSSAVFNSMLTENVDDNSITKTMKNKTKFQLQIK